MPPRYCHRSLERERSAGVQVLAGSIGANFRTSVRNLARTGGVRSIDVRFVLEDFIFGPDTNTPIAADDDTNKSAAWLAACSEVSPWRQ
jgi:hypothetical protein